MGARDFYYFYFGNRVARGHIMDYDIVDYMDNMLSKFLYLPDLVDHMLDDRLVFPHEYFFAA